MKIEYTLEEIKAALDAWTELVTPVYLNGVKHVDSDAIINYLNQGFCFKITLSDVTEWNKNDPCSIHVYPAIFNSRLKFVVIDSVSDKEDQKNAEKIKVFDFIFGEENDDNGQIVPINTADSLTLEEALRRNFTWKMHCRSWLNGILADPSGEIFKAIVIPFSDCKDLFRPKEEPGDAIRIANPSAIVFFGVVGDGSTGKLNIELILTNEQSGFNLPKTLYDISRPVPPFGGYQYEFQLLPVVDYSNEL